MLESPRKVLMEMLGQMLFIYGIIHPPNRQFFHLTYVKALNRDVLGLSYRRAVPINVENLYYGMQGFLTYVGVDYFIGHLFGYTYGNDGHSSAQTSRHHERVFLRL